MGKLADCSQKAVAAGLLTKEDAVVVSAKAKSLSETMPRRDAELAAVRSMVNDGISQLQSIRQQLGKADPIKPPEVIFRTTNKDAAMAAMAEETQATVETKMLAQAKALAGDQGKMMAAQSATEEAMLAPEGGKQKKLVPTSGKKAPRSVDRETEITEALERLNKNPEERIAIYQKARERMLALMKQNKVEIAGMEFAHGMTDAERAQAGIRKPAQHEIQREKMLSAMGELNALLKFLPPEVRGKVGGFFQLAQGGVGETELADFFTKRVKMVERELESMLKRDYLDQIKKLLKSTTPITAESKVKKSRIGDAQMAADIARKVVGMKPNPLIKGQTVADVVAVKLSELEASLTNPDLSADEHSAILYEWSITNLFGDLENQSAETLAAAHAWLSDTVARGRSEWGAKEEKRLEQVRGFAEELTAGLPAITKTGLASIEWAQSIQQYLDSFELSHYSFAQFIEQILPEGSTVVKRWQDAARRADNATQDFARKAGDRLTEHLQDAVGSKSRIAMGKAMWHLKQVVRRGVKVGNETISMTRMQAIQDLLSWAQPDVREKMEADGWTEAHMGEMRKLTDDDLSRSVMSFLRAEYDADYALINPLYKRMYGMDMPAVELYAPTRYHHQGMEQEIALFGGPVNTGATPSFAKARVSHKARLRQMDALEVYHQHLAQMAHWIHYAELIREMRGVLGTPDVKVALQQKYGQDLASDLTRWVDALARQGGSKAAEITVNQRFLDALISAKAISSLGFNPRTVAMQVDSAVRMTLALPMKRVVAAMLDPDFIATIPKVWHSDAIQRRVRGGSSPESRYLFDKTNAKPSVMLELGRASMLPIQLMDGWLTSFSSAIVFRDAYNEAIAQGFDEQGAEAHAADAMDEAIYRYSQPTGVASKSLQEVSGGQLKKIFMMFMSDPRLKTAIMAESLRGIATGRGDLKMHITRIVAIEAMAMLSQIVANLYRDLFTDAEDEDIWTWEGFALAGALAPLSGYLLVGTAGSAAITELLGNRAWSPARDPLLEAFQRGTQAARHLDDILNFTEPGKMIREWDNIARSIAFHPALALPAVVVNAIKPFVFAAENAEKED